MTAPDTKVPPSGLGGRVRPHARRGVPGGALLLLGRAAPERHAVGERAAEVAQRRAAGEPGGAQRRGALQDAAQLVQRLAQRLRLAPERRAFTSAQGAVKSIGAANVSCPA